MGLVPLALTHDGDALILNDRGHRELVIIRATTGTVVSVISYADDTGRALLAPPRVIGLSRDRRTAFVQNTFAEDHHTEVRSLALDDDERTKLSSIGPVSLLVTSAAPRLRVVAGAEPMILETRYSYSVGHGTGRLVEHWELVLHDIVPPIEAARRVPIPEPRSGRYTFSDDRHRIFMYSPHPAGILEWDLRTNTQISFLPGPEGRLIVRGPVYDDKHDRIIVGTMQRSEQDGAIFRVCVGNVREGSWIAELGYTADVLPGQPHRMKVSPGGKTLAANCMKRRLTREVTGTKILLWDLSVLGASREDERRPTDVHATDQD
jgi:hypothetical protein